MEWPAETWRKILRTTIKLIRIALRLLGKKKEDENDNNNNNTLN